MTAKGKSTQPFNALLASTRVLELALSHSENNLQRHLLEIQWNCSLGKDVSNLAEKCPGLCENCAGHSAPLSPCMFFYHRSWEPGKCILGIPASKVLGQNLTMRGTSVILEGLRKAKSIILMAVVGNYQGSSIKILTAASWCCPKNHLLQHR